MRLIRQKLIFVLCVKRSICNSVYNKLRGIAICVAVTKKVIHASVYIRSVGTY
jgi:hypothetical protein